ncbi:MAG: NAD(P)H-dependent oxidoreductase subunit E, partial [Candidatus Sumerlaeota bacterium]
MSECCCGSNASTPEVEDILRVTDEIIERIGTEEEKCIAVLQAIQNTFRYLPAEALNRVVEKTAITASQVAGVSTFYSQFRHTGTGEHLIQVCHGTACHVAGAERITDAVRRHLDLADEAETTEDGKFTVEKVGCVGCCSLAPVMLIDGYTFGHLDAQQTPDAIRKFLADEAAGLHDQQAKEREEIKRAGIESGMPPTEIRIGLNSCCIASGSQDVADSLRQSVERAGGNAVIKP